jgi:site-specific DNA-methyltransferase (adenine-specific)
MPTIEVRRLRRVRRTPLRRAGWPGRQGSAALSQFAWAHAHETLLWASKGRGHTFNHDLVNARDPTVQVSSVWRIPAVPSSEKLYGYHPTQKPLRLVRRALLASTREGDLIFDPFCGSGTTAVATKELGRIFAGAELERGFCELAGRRIAAAERGSVLREISGVLRARGGYS